MEKDGNWDENRGLQVINPGDMKAWERVQRVLEVLRLDGSVTLTLTAACKQVGIHRTTIWRDLQRPYVQQRLAEVQAGMDALTGRVLDKSWGMIIMNMANLAASESSKEAVQAARFIRDVKLDWEKRHAPDGTQKTSEAGELIKSFLGGKRLKLSQMVVTREIETSSD